MKKVSLFTSFLFSTAMAVNMPAFAQAPAKEAKSDFTPKQVEEIKKIVHEHLIASPEILVEASKSLQEKQLMKAQQEAEKGIKEHFKKIVDNPNTPVVGNPNGEVILVEFIDYQCGHCKTMSAVVDELAKRNKDLKVAIKELPIFGESSKQSAKAALASYQQGKDKFMAFHKALFGSKSRLSEKAVLELAKSSNLDLAKLEASMKDPAVEKELADNIKLAQDLKLMGTPVFIITNKSGSETFFIPGAIADPEIELQKMIDNARSAKK